MGLLTSRESIYEQPCMKPFFPSQPTAFPAHSVTEYRHSHGSVSKLASEELWKIWYDKALKVSGHISAVSGLSTKGKLQVEFCIGSVSILGGKCHYPGAVQVFTGCFAVCFHLHIGWAMNATLSFMCNREDICIQAQFHGCAIDVLPRLKVLSYETT